MSSVKELSDKADDNISNQQKVRLGSSSGKLRIEVYKEFFNKFLEKSLKYVFIFFCISKMIIH